MEVDKTIVGVQAMQTQVLIQIRIQLPRRKMMRRKKMEAQMQAVLQKFVISTKVESVPMAKMERAW